MSIVRVHAALRRFWCCNCASRKQLPPLSSSAAEVAAITAKLGIGKVSTDAAMPKRLWSRCPVTRRASFSVLRSCELSRSERSVTMRSVRIESGSGYETTANFIKLTRQVS